MLIITRPEEELFNNVTETYYTGDAFTLSLEHSLISISKWEAQYKLPFLKLVDSLGQTKHQAKLLFYVKCMSTKGEISDDVIVRLRADDFKKISEYISDTHSASISSGPATSRKGGKAVTSERIYALMACYHIPAEYARWHLNNLLMVINICAEMNDSDPKGKKKNRSDPSATAAYYEQNERLRKAGVAL